MLARFAVVVLAALALAGCGGGGSTPGGEGPGGVDTTSSAYQGGYTFCSDRTLEQLALDHSAAEPTPEAVSEAVADSVATNVPSDRENAKQGCLDAFEERGIS